MSWSCTHKSTHTHTFCLLDSARIHFTTQMLTLSRRHRRFPLNLFSRVAVWGGKCVCACVCVLVTCGCVSCHKDQPPCDQRLGDEPGGRKTTALGQSSVSTTTPGRCHTSSARCSRTIRLYSLPLPLSVFLSVLFFLWSARLFGEHDVLPIVCMWMTSRWTQRLMSKEELGFCRWVCVGW